MFQVRSNGSSFHLWDVGGQDKTRPLWRSYTRCTDAIIFVVDSSDQERLEESKLELMALSKTTNRYSIPIMVLANKQDLPASVQLDQVERQLGLKHVGKNVAWAVRSCCAVTGEGLEEALGEVKEMLEKKRTKVNSFLAAGKGVKHKKVRRSHSHYF